MATPWYEQVYQSTVGKEQAAKRKSISNIISKYESMGEEAKAANLARQQRIEGLYSDILGGIEGSESSLRRTGLADIERQKQTGIGRETQGLISGGLFGTTVTGGLEQKWESQYATPARVKLEDTIRERKAGVQTQLANFIERIENQYPDYGALLQAYIAKATM